MPILTTDFASLTDELQSIFNEAARNKVGESVGFQVYNVFDTDRLTYDHLILHGLAGHKKITEGEDFPKITSEEGKIVALYKLFLNIGDTLKKAIRGKLNHYGLLQPQRTSERAMQIA